MSILVTGGAGYIGSHVCKALKLAGFLPITYDNLSEGHPWAVQWGPLVVGDVRNKTKMLQTLHKFKPQAVIHLAALSQARTSQINPFPYYEENLTTLLSLAETMVAANIDLLIFSSSAALYKSQDLPCDENTPIDPSSPYGMTKWIGEKILFDLEKRSSLKTVSLRYFNAAGADPALEIGESHRIETHFIPLCIQAALGKREAVTLFNTSLPTKDGTAIRDYVHVSDLASAHLLALNFLLNNKKSDIFNLGSGIGFSNQEIIQAISQKKRVPILAGSGIDEPAILIASNTKAKQILSWNPVLSDLNSILETAWNWENL